MESYAKYLEARDDLVRAEKLISLIGKDQPHTTAKAKGFIHNLGVSLSVHFQEQDGSKNYHDLRAMNYALSEAALKHWKTLQDEAFEILRRKERDALIACEGDVDRVRAAIEAAKP